MPERKHADEQIQRASTHVGRWAETPAPDEFEDIAEDRAMPHAADARPDEAGTVGVAPRNGRSWNHVAIAPVVSGHAAGQRAGATGAGRR